MKRVDRVWSGRAVRRLALLTPTLMIGAAAMNIAGCVHEREVVVHDRPVVYQEPPPPPPPVQENVVVEEPAYAPAPTEVVTVYERDLNPYGHWAVVGSYGRCWIWDHRPSGWRPYTHGHWVNSDQGWIWVAEDDEAQFGEVCYHYGRWYEDPSVGWVWVPGRVWGPSWVAWREGGGYCGWAPLPPECADGVVVDQAVCRRYVPENRYYFVEERYIAEPHIHEHVVVNNVTIIQKTTIITNVTYVNNRAVNRGVRVENVEKYSNRTIERVHVTKVTSSEEARRQIASGHPVVYAPQEVAQYVKAHPVKGVQARRVNNPQPPQNSHVDQKTAEQLRAEDEARHGGGNPLNTGNPPPDRRAVDQKIAEDQRIQADREAQERAAKEKAAQEKAQRDAQERAAREREAKEKAQREADAEKMRQEKLAQEHAAAEKAAAEKAAAEKAARERVEQERLAREQAAQRAAAEKAAAEKAAAEKAAAEKAARAAADRAAQQRAAEEKAARDRAAQEKDKDKNKNGQKPGDSNNPNNSNGQH